MLLPLLGLVYFLALSPQAVLSLFQLISYSPIQQCGPFNVTFVGGTPPTAFPLTLTVLPFNSTPLAFTVPQSAWNNSTASGSFVAFLPLPEGVSLMASLDDASGNSAALTSEVIRIRSSDNTSCISTTINATAPSTFRLQDTTVSQCSPFNVTRSSSSPNHPISVRAFIQADVSYRLQRSYFYTSEGVDVFTFIMTAARGFQVLLLFDDGRGNRQVSDLLSVAGGSSTPTKCLQNASTTPTASGLSRSSAIAIAATSSVIVIVVVILGVFFVRRERRRLAILRRNTVNTIQNHGQFGDPNFVVNPPVPPRPSRMPPFAPIARVPTGPMALPVAPSPRSSVFSPFVPSSLGFGKSQSNSSPNPSIRTKSITGGSNSRPLVDLDIAGLLEVASVTHRESEMDTHSNSSSGIPASTLTVPPLGRKRSHRDLDVPLSPLRRFSGDSLTVRGPSTLAQDTRAAMLNNDDLPGQGTSSTSSRDAGVRSRSKKPVRF